MLNIFFFNKGKQLKIILKKHFGEIKFRVQMCNKQRPRKKPKNINKALG